MSPSDSLGPYRKKRSFERTAEPAGGMQPADDATAAGAGPARTFVVQKHSARNLHYDFRLELGGVLKSWAVPKGPSYDPSDKRFAAHVEDHPLEYADFEGVIPAGNYGAGPVVVWDRGTWLALEDPEEGLEKGKLLFQLRGAKLVGRWTLVRMKTDKDWLLIKERDARAHSPGTDFDERSIYSGLTVEELGEGVDRAAPIVEALDDLDAPRRVVRARDVKVMLAESRDTAFSREGWVFELKYDGYRVVAARQGGEAILLSRNGNELTDTFPELATVLRALPYDSVVLDGEVVVHDERGMPSFQRLQRRGQLRRALDIRRMAVRLPATLYAFDLLAFEGYDVRPLPLLERKRLLHDVLPAPGPLRYSEHIPERGEALFAQVERMGLEGIVAKKADARYRGGRSRNWVKVRSERADDFVVVGYTRPGGTRAGFGALHLAAYDDGDLVFAGSVGTGFAEKQIRQAKKRLDAHRRETPAARGAPEGAEHTWVEPETVVEVRYLEVTDDGLLRQPVFLRFRDDKRPEECRLPVSRHTPATDAAPGNRNVAGGAAFAATEFDSGNVASPAAGRPAANAAPARSNSNSNSNSKGGRRPEKAVRFTNLDKVFWPEGYTKGDLVHYYATAAEWMLPYLRDRPLVQTRYPDGIGGKSFFQKDAPEWAPDWVRTETLYSEGSERDLRYFVCDDVESLLYIANGASIPIHVWSSRVGSLERPDWAILDLDPKDAPFEYVVDVARLLKEVCDDIELPCFIKTSGSSGLHVLLPTGRRLTHEQARQLAELLARVVVAELPDRATIARTVSKREGRVYVDYLQNGWGKLLAAPFSARPVPGARVSTPLRWHEVTPALDIRRFTIKSVPRRMAQLKEDPLRGVLEGEPDIVSALGRLEGWGGVGRPGR
jgi:bifunctional non-homologous end joining protein LigD